jgi:nucleotide-binding universal stress UspA family protein
MTTKVIAWVDDSAAVRPVLAVARESARTLDAGIEAVHVMQDGDATARAEAGAADVPFRTLQGPVAEAIEVATSEPDVVAVVLGLRRTPGGARPAGSVATRLITSVDRPVVLVPPDCPMPYQLRHVLVPLAGDPRTAASLTNTIEVAGTHQIEVIVLHVYDEASLPAFTDQPQYETDVWAREFLARYVSLSGHIVHLELRVGVPGEQVLQVAGEMPVDMIALGWGQDLSSDRARIVRSVLERSTIPVLLLPIVQRAQTALA